MVERADVVAFTDGEDCEVVPEALGWNKEGESRVNLSGGGGHGRCSPLMATVVTTL
jgi:hypothetical protein